ncbi:unnamed protein product, partial [marine sediment metagenome]
MAKKDIKQTVQELLIQADIKINGKRPWDIQVNNQDLYSRILAGGILAIGEAYMDGWWECSALDQLVDKIFKEKWDTKIKISKGLLWDTIKARIINQ